MINFKQEDIFKINVEAIINTVNTVGVMGKGIALQFKDKFPENYKAYKKACDNEELRVGKLFITETYQILNPKFIINFPTKEHWKERSKIEYITKGLKALKEFLVENNIKSVAIPPLGAGNGGLNWKEVKVVIQEELSELEDIEIIVLEPSDKFYEKKDVLKKAKLTESRALILNLFQQYIFLGFELSLLEVQKLAYFLQRFGEPLKLNFEKSHYGPFASNLNHLLNTLDNNFIVGLKAGGAKPLDKLTLINDRLVEVDNFIIDNCTNKQKERLNRVSKLIEGFEYPFGMELLATVDFILDTEPETHNDLPKIVSTIQSWSKRKKELMKPEYISIAYNRLMEYKDYLYSKDLVNH